jgi:hypothetical protein
VIQVVYLKLIVVSYGFAGFQQEYTGLGFGEDVEIIKPLEIYFEFTLPQLSFDFLSSSLHCES